jgi:hypothetical protein
MALTACGRDDYENEPRPPLAAEISIQMDDDDITLAPAEFGAGIANITIANLGRDESAIQIDGPTTGETDDIPPGTTTVLKMEMKTGEYEAIAPGLDAEPFAFEVGPERESANNDLQLP